MKKLSLVLLVLALALAVAPVATATPLFTFSFTDGTVTGSGTLTGTAITRDEFNITGGSGTFSGGGIAFSGPIYPTPTPPNISYSPSGQFLYDNLVFPGAAASGLILDSAAGILFVDPVTTNELNLWGNGGINNYSIYEWTAATGYIAPPNGTFTLSFVPEPSMAFLLIPALGFVGVIRQKFMV
jgi:hypothetical protein